MRVWRGGLPHSENDSCDPRTPWPSQGLVRRSRGRLDAGSSGTVGDQQKSPGQRFLLQGQQRTIWARCSTGPGLALGEPRLKLKAKDAAGVRLIRNRLQAPDIPDGVGGGPSERRARIGFDNFDLQVREQCLALCYQMGRAIERYPGFSILA